MLNPSPRQPDSYYKVRQYFQSKKDILRSSELNRLKLSCEKMSSIDFFMSENWKDLAIDIEHEVDIRPSRTLFKVILGELLMREHWEDFTKENNKLIVNSRLFSLTLSPKENYSPPLSFDLNGAIARELHKHGLLVSSISKKLDLALLTVRKMLKFPEEKSRFSLYMPKLYAGIENDIRRELIRAALKECDNNYARASKMLGITYITLVRMEERFSAHD